MRKINKEELEKLSNFMVEQYFEKEELQKTFYGVNQNKAKDIAVKMVFLEMEYYFDNGDIFVYDDNLTGAIIGIEYKKMSILKALPSAFKTNKILSRFSKEEINKIKENKKMLNKVHSSKWFKKYCKNPYYCAQFAIAKDKRGQGIAREMFEFLFDHAKDRTDNIMLETLSEDYVPICKHFGFEVKEVFETDDKEFKEYRMLKKVID